MKLLLLRTHTSLDKFYFPGYINEPLGILSLAAFLRDICEVRVVDATAEGWNYYWQKPDNPDVIYHGIKPDKVLKIINKFKPDVVGITWLFSSDNDCISDTVKAIKKQFPGMKIIVGGAEPSANPRAILEKNSEIDAVAFGEGELTMKELVLKEFRDLKQILGIAYRDGNQIIVNPFRPRIKNLDDLPLPARDLIPMINYSKQHYFNFIFSRIKKFPLSFKTKYLLAAYLSKLPFYKIHFWIYNRRHNIRLVPEADVVTARGCPFCCAFCAIHNIWRHQWIARSSKNVLEEIDILVKKYKVRHINIQDDNFNASKQRTIEIAKGIVGRNYNITLSVNSGIYVPTLDEEVLKWLKRAGLHLMRFSIESGNQKVLDEIIKKRINLKMVKPIVDICRRLNIKTEGAFIFGIPGQTIKTMEDNLKFAKECGFDRIKKFVYQPFPNTELYKICEEKRYFTKDYDLRRIYVTGSKCYVKTEDFSPEDVLSIARSDH